jgi:hypothetical protein
LIWLFNFAGEESVVEVENVQENENGEKSDQVNKTGNIVAGYMFCKSYAVLLLLVNINRNTQRFMVKAKKFQLQVETY